MHYFKHSELVNDYHVSLKTVHNWIDAAKQGKLELSLCNKNGRTYIASTPANHLVLDTLANNGKKYRNTLHHKIISPKPEFYSTYNRRQVLDIISNLTIHHELPQQYNYLDGGAINWDDWMNRLADDDSTNILKGTVELINDNLDSLDKLLDGYKKVNIIDVGVGNAHPSRPLLEHLAGKGTLNRYIAIDISQGMLNIAKQNVTKWLGDKARFEGHVRDISYERFDDLLIDDMLGNKANETLNLVLVLGSTVANFRFPMDVLRVIYGSMGSQDLLLYTRKPDTRVSRHYFDFSIDKADTTISPLFTHALGLLNIDPSLYTAEMGFNEETRMRYIQIRLKTAFTIRFSFGNSVRDVVFEKGDTILLLRVWHQTILELISQFDEMGFTLLQSSLTKDREYLLTISGVVAD
jgi:SAM-dependent methyltransferase